MEIREGGGLVTRDLKGRKGDDSNLDFANTVNRVMLDECAASIDLVMRNFTQLALLQPPFLQLKT